MMLLPLIISCVDDNFKEEEALKELMATVSSEFTVADGAELTFVDLSFGVSSRVWTFPGGIPETSTEPAVNVAFQEEGEVQPTLEITYFDGTKEVKTFDITVFPVLIADFEPSATRIKVGESITFTDASIGSPTSWSWEFPSGNPAISTEQNPTVTFNINQPVEVMLTITRSADGNEVSETKMVQIGPPELILNGDFENGAVVGWQTWNGDAFPYDGIEIPGANGTATSSSFTYTDTWSFAQIISRDFADYKVSLEPGKDYILSMYVKAGADGVSLGTFRVVNHLPEWSGACQACVEEGYTEYYPNGSSVSGIPFVLTTDWQQVSIQITIPDDGVLRTNAFPDIIFGADVTTKVFIDEISLKVVD
ncbi:carbohydrate binding domain-containing protein [Reichenbachiella faecimaris]|nr:PKD domain-containing protein [Reichenbachiella faecimaris]